ncbi:MAG TPA: ABC transporter substrate-binding protein [Geminicoccus sp.]|uniref:ABC transporter substrate-binding protein n=1 Tax=Geminicoccus sp. TaxID=2024832 RepID=UPI002E3418C4|nr:ABC transporter substrate-binding protein [Geminicoccus sp.]HEX2525802.1 ABC transporter substrate-binding protein [Geminicoccus sp.]
MATRRFTLGAIALTAALVAGNVADAKEWKTIRFGTEGAYAPFNYVTPEGELAGFDVDIANALCVELNVECELVQQDWDGMIPALMANKYDAIIASMSITDERKQRIDFTDKYYNTPTRLVAKKGSGIDGTPESLSGKKIGVQRETVQDRYATEVFEPAGAEIVRYGTGDEANLDLVAGRVDVRLEDSVVLSENFLKKDEGTDFEFIGPPFSDPKWFGYGAGIGVRKGETDLVELLNKGITALRANGKYDEIQKKYFDFDVYGS